MIAIKEKLKINNYRGLKNDKRVTGKTGEEVYAAKKGEK